MSQTKAQLIAPVGIVTTQGVVVTGVMTATSFTGDIVGSATSIISGSNLNLGTVTSTESIGFSGDFTGSATGIKTGADIKVGSFTATSFTGDFTGTATSMMRGTGFKAGVVNATGFVANVEGNVTGNVTGNVSVAGSVASGSNIHVGVITATSYSGDGSSLTGIAATNFNTQVVTANSAETIIDIADGNMITMNQSANTTVGFASTATSNYLTLIRIKDTGTTARTITWPSSIRWNGGIAPTLIQDNYDGTEEQQFQFLTRDGGLTWYGWEAYKSEIETFTLDVFGAGNERGQLGMNNRTNYSSPVQIGADSNWKSVNGSYDSWSQGTSSFVDGSSRLWTVGSNTYGSLGHNSRTERSSPTQVGTDSDWAFTVNSQRNMMGVKTDGTLWSWGYNGQGNLGLNNTGSPALHGLSSPVQVGTDTDWSSSRDKYIIQSEFSGAIKTDGRLYMWGANQHGQLGKQNRTKYSSPTSIGGTDWKWVSSANASFVAAIRTDGTLWTWGANEYGYLGQNQSDNKKKSSATQVGSGTDWNYVHCSECVMATKTDGTLWGWGPNAFGCLGVSPTGGGSYSTNSRSSPIQIPGTTWVRPLGGQLWSGCFKTDGTLWMWGRQDTSGALGQNNRTNRSSPVQVPGSWKYEDRNRFSSHSYGMFLMTDP